jgi:chromosome segregation ATPase
MKSTLNTLLILVALGLCGLSVVQWKREAALRARVAEVTKMLQVENRARVESEEKAAAFEKEIARITQLREDTEAKLLEVTEELVATQADQLQRGFSIAVLSVEIAQARALAGAAEQQLAATQSAIGDRNDAVVQQNEAITTANERLKQLAAERDKAIAELNARTRAYNELVEKYNKVVK